MSNRLLSQYNIFKVQIETLDERIKLNSKLVRPVPKYYLSFRTGSSLRFKFVKGPIPAKISLEPDRLEQVFTVFCFFA